QCHSQEDGTFKCDRTVIGAGCTIGVNAFILYGVTMGDGASLAADSFLLKGEGIPPRARWARQPAKEAGEERPERGPAMAQETGGRRRRARGEDSRRAHGSRAPDGASPRGAGPRGPADRACEGTRRAFGRERGARGLLRGRGRPVAASDHARAVLVAR